MDEIIKKLLAPGEGLLAADESTGTIAKRLAAVGVTSTPETNRKYREMLFTTPGIDEYISGVILFKETVDQKLDDGTPFVDFLKKLNIVLGIKLDGGLEKYKDTNQEITKVPEDLENSIRKFHELGFGFAKWRALFSISDLTPSDEFIADTLDRMVSYAASCQEIGLVPIVEPEVSMKGNHTTTRCEEITTKVLKTLFAKLKERGVDMSNLVLKINMVLPGKDSGVVAEPLEVANSTLRTLSNSVPKEVGVIVFLSGGQDSWSAAENLDKIEDLSKDAPWPLTFSYSRALQEEPMRVWQGKDENIDAAQTVFLGKLKEASLARQGKL